MEKTEVILVWVTRVLFVILAVAGATYILYPEQTIRYYTGLGTSLGTFPAPPYSTSYFWIDLSFSYMVLVSAFCFLAQRDIRRNWRIYGLLALGKFSSAITAAFSFLLYGAFIYLATILTDGLIAVFAVVAYFLMSRLTKPPPARTS